MIKFRIKNSTAEISSVEMKIQRLCEVQYVNYDFTMVNKVLTYRQ